MSGTLNKVMLIGHLGDNVNAYLKVVEASDVFRWQQTKATPKTL